MYRQIGGGKINREMEWTIFDRSHFLYRNVSHRPRSSIAKHVNIQFIKQKHRDHDQVWMNGRCMDVHM
ncbi:hypothetical protein EYR41_008399 [Orbilia oligospora]|uniref:Uncharacterized protein n=1 Tax=Orbilia oligospora TaxID=2813651 RepID=A0A8H2HPP1_ORBOL|nr:hypothetical protein TWF128_006522 [Orbilia oligospora]KAF3266933.1 hypothetical protein TWF217_001017 [Orbilia oligospora]KAF3292161.1 hypothetical protein TWF132_005837 [Orbilia oligospora]TGJ66798.1 hypothetical protein EYR41_008399 [Orbilia oligospora]